MIRVFVLAGALAFGAGAALAERIDINGVTRTFTAQLPDTRPAPLVIVLHGNTQTGADMASRTSWPEIAKREHFGIAFPTGLIAPGECVTRSAKSRHRRCRDDLGIFPEVSVI